MAILNFSGFKDANGTAQVTTMPAGLNQYMNGKFPCFKGSCALLKDSGMTYSFDAGLRHQFKFNNNLNEYGVFGFGIVDFVGESAPVGATLTFGYLLTLSIARAIYGCWLSNGALSAVATAPAGAAVTGARYVEFQLKKTSATNVDIVTLVNGVAVGSKVSITVDAIMNTAKMAWIGFSGGAYGGERFGATNATLHLTDMYVSYNTDGQDEFLGRPTITRVGATVVDRGSWTNPNGTYTDQQIGEYTTKTGLMFLDMDRSTLNTTFAASRLADNPIVFKGEDFTPAAGTSIRAIQVTAMSKSLDATVRTPQSVVLKNADSGDKISGAGTNALNVNTFTPTSATIDAPLDTNKLIVEVSATDYKP
ncbi:hypothetical protein POP15_064 [Pectobacterium phage POP15]|nr:hypothetical protein POP15_064 [Pectobacterium phage POP15]